jgi:hypothetical protein
VTKRVWLYFCGAALLAEVCGTWLQSFRHATDVPFAVTFTTRGEYATDRLFLWAVFFVPLMIIAALLSRRKGSLLR